MLPLVLAALLAAPVSGPGFAFAQEPPLVAAVTIDCAGTFAAAGVATHAASWRLVVSAWHLALGPFDSSGWRTRTFEGQGTTFERHGALFAAPALAFEAHLDVDGVTVASSACGAAPFA